ncbi:hypothetical protein KUTeg_011114 [Tegillarca granosa]|uniref:H-type lectin domain-containing protein n=1 Tax=Tegillarca granosa TaxID=220873 RepID=A0ABQ9F351_TEGGR|nr:hypothetical protein KUTeg_011114 [Tegillarca granosa]
MVNGKFSFSEEQNFIAHNLRNNYVHQRKLRGHFGQTGEYGLLRAPNPPSWPGTKKIKFNPPFSTKPSIVHGFVVLDSDRSRNFRASVTVSDVSKTGFTLTLSKWADTKLYGLKVRWMACR